MQPLDRESRRPRETSVDPRPTPEAPPAPRKPYHAPELTVHGRIEELTRNIGPIGTDGVTGSQL